MQITILYTPHRICLPRKKIQILLYSLWKQSVYMQLTPIDISPFKAFDHLKVKTADLNLPEDSLATNHHIIQDHKIVLKIQMFPTLVIENRSTTPIPQLLSHKQNKHSLHLRLWPWWITIMQFHGHWRLLHCLPWCWDQRQWGRSHCEQSWTCGLPTGVLGGEGEPSSIFIKHFGDGQSVFVTIHADDVVLGD